MDKVKTGELIREARKAKNYTQSELGDMLGVTNKAISRWECGDSFPDVGVLENLAQILGLKIQDIVTGEIHQVEEINTEQALAELLRQSKIQLREKKNRVLGILLAFATLFCGVLAGIAGLSGSIFCFDDAHGTEYYVLFALTLTIIVYGWSVQDGDAVSNSKKVKVMSIISAISLFWAVFMTGAVSLLVSNGYVPFGMELGKIGPFIAIQLIVVFVLNIILIAVELFWLVKGSGEIHFCFILQAAVLYISALYGNLLHRMASVDEFFTSLFVRTGVVMAEMAIAFIIMKIVKAGKK